eukprot:Transcript_24689.p1 GENE.Transcript_24689~~Transcript_24689.p1  ORF type:complete len:349 (-),score=135.47 Transcript_24689:179-1120(-)
MQPTLSSIASAAQQAATTTVVVKSFNSEGVAFFNSMRTPAALLAAAAIKDAFVLAGSVPEDVRRSESNTATPTQIGGHGRVRGWGLLSRTPPCPGRAWTILRDVYLLLQLLTFASTLTTVFIATHAIVSLQMSAGVSERAHAASLIAMMKTSFEYEYVSVRATFMSGLLSFAMAQALRVRFALRKAQELSWAAMYFMLCTVAYLFAYNNSKSITYGGYLGLVAKWLRLTREMLAARASNTHPMPLVCLLLFAAGCLCTLRVLFRNLFEQLDDDKDGRISFDEAVGFVAALPVRLWRSFVVPAGPADIIADSGP